LSSLLNNIRVSWLVITLSCLSGCATRKAPSDFSPEELHKVLAEIDFSNVAFISPSSGLADPHEVRKFFPIPERRIENKLPYHAASDQERFEELAQAANGDAKFIWATRGGYGSGRLFKKLAAMPKPKQKKILIGYSDITFLHMFTQQYWQWRGIHASMPGNYTQDVENFTRLAAMLSAGKGSVTYDGLKPLNKAAMTQACISGTSSGGNLTLLIHSLGTPYHFRGAKKLIFLEDVNVKGYVIDRDLTHLQQAGVFSGAAAIIFGDFLAGDDHVTFALERFAKNIDVPVFVIENFGHGHTNFPLPLGYPGQIHNGQLRVHYNFLDL
jgi:muramoyltetrapeptide carboxypeptidase